MSVPSTSAGDPSSSTLNEFNCEDRTNLNFAGIDEIIGSETYDKYGDNDFDQNFPRLNNFNADGRIIWKDFLRQGTKSPKSVLLSFFYSKNFFLKIFSKK